MMLPHQDLDQFYKDHKQENWEHTDVVVNTVLIDCLHELSRMSISNEDIDFRKMGLILECIKTIKELSQ